MTSRERVRFTVEHKKTDRYPIDLGMHFSTGISIFAYYKLRRALGLSTDDIRLADTVQMLARVDDDIRERFHIDTTLLFPEFKSRKIWRVREYEFWIPKQMNPETGADGVTFVTRGSQRMRMPKGGYFFDGDWIQFRDGEGGGVILSLAREAERLRKESDRFTCLIGAFNGFFTGIDMACDMLTDPEAVRAFNRELLKTQTADLELFAKNGGAGVDCVEINSDLGMQSGPMLSPSCYEEFVYPYMKEFIKRIRTSTGAKVFLHCCGSVEPLIPYFIDAGVDCLNPVQVSAQGMEPAVLKKKYGGKICFWDGGCDTQTVLGVKSPEEVRADVKKLTDVFKREGGFVFNQVHNIMGDVPPENIIAMLDAAYENSGF